MIKRVILIVNTLILFSLCLNSFANSDEHLFKTYTSISTLGEPKYKDDFIHVNYVNPQAPKGGEIILSAVGTFDNFNRFASRGVSADRTESLYDTLYTQTLDDATSFYPLIAESIKIREDNLYAEVSLNPLAVFHDNKPITVDDVTFTFDKFNTEGVPQFAKKFKGVTLNKIDNLTFSISLPVADKTLLLDFITLPIFPKHIWENLKLNEPQTVPMVGSGPYKIGDYKMGQYVVYDRVKDYWAKNLPVTKGHYNFDRIRYEYFLDGSVTLEAFKSGAFDVQIENKAKQWHTAYQGKNFDNGNIIKVERIEKGAVNTQWFAFNTQSAKFSNRLVRKAFSYALDFEWLNKMMFYGSYSRTNSIFQNTQYQAVGLPSEAELAILMPFKDILPKEVFGAAYKAPVTDGSGHMRDNLTTMLNLLNEAGWTLINGQLINNETKAPFEFELLTYSGSSNGHLLQFQQTLKKIGIKMNIREVDITQYSKRMRDRDFDMIVRGYPKQIFPDTNLFYYWHSHYIDSTYNSPGVINPAVDSIIEQISDAQGNEEKLIPLGRALDRIITWEHFIIPQWFSGFTRFAYWNKFGIPETYPVYDIGIDTWWYDENKASALLK